MEETSRLVSTDPPYNVSYEGKTKDALTIKNDSMKDGEFRQFLHDGCWVEEFVSALIWN
jgi:DNA modification methylase